MWWKKNNAGITIYDISDHLPVFVNLKLYHPTQQNIKPKYRYMKHFDLNTFLTDLSHNLNNLNPEAGEVNTFSDKFVKVFNDTLDKHAPYRYASRKEQRSVNEWSNFAVSVWSMACQATMLSHFT